jgi:hypothetical protein
MLTPLLSIGTGTRQVLNLNISIKKQGLSKVIKIEGTVQYTPG